MTKDQGRSWGAPRRRPTGLVSCLAVSMRASTVLCSVLALVAVLATPGPAAAVPAGQAPAQVAVATRTICPGDQFEITISNPGTQTYQVAISVLRSSSPAPEVTSITIDPGETEQVVLVIAGTPMDVSIDGDQDFPDEQVVALFRCTRTVDITATTQQDTPVVIDLLGPCATGSATPHGSVEQIDNFTIRYSPDAGFVGVDSFGYSCSSSAEQEGVVTVTVLPTQAPPAAPVPESPTFTG